MKKDRETKEPVEPVEKHMKVKGGLATVIVPLVIALALFFTLIIYQKNQLKAYNTTEVVVAITEVPEKTVISKGNVATYFQTIKVNENAVVKGAITSTNDLVGLIAAKDLHTNEIISKYSMTDEKDYVASLKEPVEISFAVKDAANAVGGTLRAGDVVDVSVFSDSSQKLEAVLKNVYIKQTYDSSNNVVNAGEPASAVVFVCVVNKEDTTNLIEKLSEGEVHVTLPE